MPVETQLPTIAETLPGYARDGSHSLLAPVEMPRSVIAKINGEVRRIFDLPDVKERIKTSTTSPR